MCKATQKFTVSCIEASSKKIKTRKIPDTVWYNCVSYQVVSVEKAAFAGCRKLKAYKKMLRKKGVSVKAKYKAG